MIIQCEKCATKYRFDDNLLEGDGVWVRCSRCKHEFFQENPFARPFPTVDDDAVLKNLDDLRSGIREREPDDLSFAELTGQVEEDSAVREGTANRQERPAERTGRGMRILKGVFKVLLLLAVLALIAGVSLWSYRQLGGQLSLRDIRPYVPYLDQFMPTAEDPGIVKLSQIKVTNLSQRYVQHWILGNILVVEGTAWNSTPYPVARIRVEARLFDGQGAVLAREEAFAGNLLTDMELTTLPEETMRSELVLTEGSDVSNDRVEPRGQIPFMIVFARDYPGAARTMVHVSGVEKLLTP